MAALIVWGLLYVPYVPIVRYMHQHRGSPADCPGCDDDFLFLPVVMPFVILVVGLSATIVLETLSDEQGGEAL